MNRAEAMPRTHTPRPRSTAGKPRPESPRRIHPVAGHREPAGSPGAPRPPDRRPGADPGRRRGGRAVSEDNDGRFPDDSRVEVLLGGGPAPALHAHPRSRERHQHAHLARPLPARLRPLPRTLRPARPRSRRPVTSPPPTPSGAGRQPGYQSPPWRLTVPAATGCRGFVTSPARELAPAGNREPSAGLSMQSPGALRRL